MTKQSKLKKKSVEQAVRKIVEKEVQEQGNVTPGLAHAITGQDMNTVKPGDLIPVGELADAAVVNLEGVDMPEVYEPAPEVPAITNAVIEVPLVPLREGVHIQRHIEIGRLSNTQCAALRRISDALIQKNAQLELSVDGIQRVVRNPTDAIRWILEQVKW